LSINHNPKKVKNFISDRFYVWERLRKYYFLNLMKAAIRVRLGEFGKAPIKQYIARAQRRDIIF
jgi:hypothetical protein